MWQEDAIHSLIGSLAIDACKAGRWPWSTVEVEGGELEKQSEKRGFENGDAFPALCILASASAFSLQRLDKKLQPVALQLLLYTFCLRPVVLEDTSCGEM